MSDKHILEVTCDRCGNAESFDVLATMRLRNQYTPNYQPTSEQLYKASEIRPQGWGSADFKVGDGSAGMSKRFKDLCPKCFTEVKFVVDLNVTVQRELDMRQLASLKMVAGILGETFDQLVPQTDEGKRLLSLYNGTVGEFYDGSPLEVKELALKKLAAARAFVFNALDTSQRSREVSRILEQIFTLLDLDSDGAPAVVNQGEVTP